MTVLRAAVVGVGPFGLRHAAHWGTLPGVKLAGVYDLDRARAEAAGQVAGCAVLRGLEEVAERADVVSVAVPTPLHAEVAAALLEAGRHVLVEKPPALVAREAMALVELAHARRCVLEVGLVERFNPAVRALRALGVRPLLLQATRLGPYPKRAAGLDVVLDWMIHDLDLCLHLAGGAVRRVEAAGVAVVGATLDAASARLWVGEGVCDVAAVRLAPAVRRSLRVVTADAVYEADLAARTLTVVRGARGVAERVPVPAEDPLRAELAAFAAAARGDALPAVGAEAGARALELAVRVREAAQAGGAAAGVARRSWPAPATA
ncbi:MAG TPA: Gfo/Idh/MocA family oxidoreductase [Myxococcota bacterium]|jgi:predicted dehydrogenase|nr:Gfo/Idh/MocA family oxidoreductase [Myxococcota bacterium]